METRFEKLTRSILYIYVRRLRFRIDTCRTNKSIKILTLFHLSQPKPSLPYRFLFRAYKYENRRMMMWLITPHHREMSHSISFVITLQSLCIFSWIHAVYKFLDARLLRGPWCIYCFSAIPRVWLITIESSRKVTFNTKRHYSLKLSLLKFIEVLLWQRGGFVVGGPSDEVVLEHRVHN